MLDKWSNLSIFKQTQKKVTGILSRYFTKSFLRNKIKTKLFNLNEIIYIVLPILKITSIWRSVFFWDCQDHFDLKFISKPMNSLIF